MESRRKEASQQIQERLRLKALKKSLTIISLGTLRDQYKEFLKQYRTLEGI
jgi:hypothetical protein